MTVDARLALTKLYDDVVADVAARSPSVQQYFGWREKNRAVLPLPAVLPDTADRNPYGARIDWQPGSDDGALGDDLPARNIGRRKVHSTFAVGEDHVEYAARSLADLDEICVVRIRAHDPLHATDERAQYVLTRMLYDLWRAAVYRCAHGVAFIDTIRWNVQKNEFRSGAQIEVVLRLRATIPDDMSTQVSEFEVAWSAYLNEVPT